MPKVTPTARSRASSQQEFARPKVGPADDATRRAALAEYEQSAKREARAGMYQGQQKADKPMEGRSSPLPNIGKARREMIDRKIDRESRGE